MKILAAKKPVRLHQRAVRLLDQQFWLWGCDVKHPGGNLLIRFGFRRISPPDSESSSSSVYVLEIDSCKRVVLRGSAAFYGNDHLGGLLVKRFDSQLYKTPAAQLEKLPHKPDCLPPLAPFQQTDQLGARLASEFFHWLAQYEAWVLEKFGVEYVTQCLKLRGKQPVETTATESEWQSLAGKFR